LTIATFKTVFPPLLIEIQHHLLLLKQVVDCVVGGGAVPKNLATPAYWAWYETADSELLKRLPSEDLREAWRELGRVHKRFIRSSEDALAAAAKGEGAHAREYVDAAFAASNELVGLLVGGAIAELLSQIKAHEGQLVARYERDFLQVAHMGRFAVRLADQVLIDADDSFLQFCGYQRDELVGDPIQRLFGKQVWSRILGVARSEEKGARVAAKAKHRNGTHVSLELTPFIEGSGGEELLRAFALNVTEAEAEAQQRRLMATAMEASDQGLVVTDAESKIIYVNPAFTRITGYAPEEALGKNPRFLQGPETNQATRMAMREALAAGKPVQAEIVNYHKSGRSYWLNLSIIPVRDDQGDITHYVSSQMDITERKRAEQAIARMAMEDHLTGLANRRAAEDRLEMEWNRARRDHGTFALAIVDIDRFKLVNDQYGHHVGDEVLKHVASVMAGNLRGGDWVARWGGEEFIVCFHDMDRRSALTAAERLRKQIKSRPVALLQGELPVTASMGVALYERGHAGIDALLAQADALLYEAKVGGRDRVMCSGTDGTRKGGVIWEGAQVQSALHEGRIVPAFQAIVDLRTGKIVAEEALARIRAKDDALIPAQKFIEAAEALHLVAAIDQSVSARALERRWQTSKKLKSGAAEIAHFINLSPQFLANSESVEELLQRAHKPGAEGAAVVIEITERQSGDILQLKKNLKPLIDAGFHLALDDFGSGYSSFLYLAELPVNFIKIEGWMVQRIIRDKRIRQLVETLVNTARKFKITSVAECVEDAQTAQVLCDLGVDWAQGYYFSKPLVE
jgi:diguanylate cyclase (GGDEF)-like protein/PAS domain S-box-containing protein